MFPCQTFQCSLSLISRLRLFMRLWSLEKEITQIMPHLKVDYWIVVRFMFSFINHFLLSLAMILLVTGHGFTQSKEDQVMYDSGIAVRRYENHEDVLALQGDELEEGAGELP